MFVVDCSGIWTLIMVRIMLPKWCSQRRIVRAKRRDKFNGLSWMRFNVAEALPLEVRHCCSDDKDNGSSTTTEKMNFEDKKFSKHFSRRNCTTKIKDLTTRGSHQQKDVLNSLQRDICLVDCGMSCLNNCSNSKSRNSSDVCGTSYNKTINGEHYFIDGELVWARTNECSWWPAKVIKKSSERDDIINERLHGGLVVSFYGKQICVCVDAIKDVSKFNEGYWEKINRSTKGFREAVNEALINGSLNDYDKICSSICQRPSSLAGEQLTGNTNKADDDGGGGGGGRENGEDVEHGRGKRKRKRKLHFDEKEEEEVVSFSTKSFRRRTRRLKIMRSLGLAAPSGSPFALNRPSYNIITHRAV